MYDHVKHKTFAFPAEFVHKNTHFAQSPKVELSNTGLKHTDELFTVSLVYGIQRSADFFCLLAGALDFYSLSTVNLEVSQETLTVE